VRPEPASIISWRRLAQLGPFRWGRLMPARALRIAFGVVLPLAAGWFAGHVEYGAYMALGALPAGFASFQGQSRTRVAAIALASIGMAVSTFVGATTAASTPWLLPAIIAIWAYITGLSICLGPVASVAVLQWSVALIIAIGLPLGPEEAAVRSAFVLAGGFLQAALVAMSWTLRTGSTERTALAQSYRALAAYASQLATGPSAAPPPPAAFPAATALADANPLLPARERLLLLNLLEEAERIRASLAALAAHDERASDVRALMSEAATALELAGDALTAKPEQRGALASELAARVARLSVAVDARWRWSGEAVVGQLRAIVHSLQALELPRRHLRGSEQANAAPTAVPGDFAAAVAQLRASVTTTGEAGRHALRLAVVAALAEVIVQATGLYQGRWVVLTILIVLKPDYGTTLYRGVHRALGTALGAVIAALVARLSHSDPGWLVAAASVAAVATFALFEVSYLLFSVPITAFILLLLAMLGAPVVAGAEARVFDTFTGALLSLVAYLAWPTWLGASAQHQFAALVEAHRDYAAALLGEVGQAGSVGTSRLRELQTAARRARGDAEAAVARLAEEPVHPPLTPEFAERLVATVARLAHAELALHALVHSETQDPARPRGVVHVEGFIRAMAGTLTSVANALRDLKAPPPAPSLRPIYADLVAAPEVKATALVDIADRMVDATNSLHDLVRQRLPPLESPSSPAEGMT